MDRRRHEIFAGVPLLGHHGGVTPAERTRWICERARAAGFELCGVAPVEKFDELEHLPDWLRRGYAGDMGYLHDPRRGDPRLVLEGARSLIVVAINYRSPHRLSTERPAAHDDDAPRGWISRYAWGDDYHEVIQAKLRGLVAEMRAQWPEPFEARTYADTGPILERPAAKHAGLGWLGKNTCLIHPQLGSWLFLGVILTTLALEPTVTPSSLPPQDLCGTCTRCLDACPTQAFPDPYVLDARRCISYLTIELRGAIPEGLRAHIGNAVIGCDICQDVCPWNRKAPVTSLAAFQPREIRDDEGSRPEILDAESRRDGSQVSLFAPELEWLASLSQEEFSAVFRRSAVKRAKWRGLVRNACVALGNSRVAPGRPAHSRVVLLLERLATSDDPLISEHAQWALAQLARSDAPVPSARTQ
jgi:epoxyqueuosine reductase